MRQENVWSEWVKGYYEGDKCKYAISLSSESVGYVILKSGKNGTTPFCTAAFLWPAGMEQIPDHLEKLTPEELVKVEEVAQRRAGKKDKEKG